MSEHSTDFFFFNDTATTEIYTLSLHDALPICCGRIRVMKQEITFDRFVRWMGMGLLVLSILLLVNYLSSVRSEEYTSELQSRQYLVCRLLLEKKHDARR